MDNYPGYIHQFWVRDRVKLLESLKKQLGFTLIEMLVAIAILSILAAIAISQYSNYKIKAYDTSAKAHIKNALTAVENYLVVNSTYPASHTDLLAYGLNLSAEVCFTKYRRDDDDDDDDTGVHFHIMHKSSPNNWHTEYPEDGGEIEHRNPATCI